jgi:hypothetical protein
MFLPIIPDITTGILNHIGVLIVTLILAFSRKIYRYFKKMAIKGERKIAEKEFAKINKIRLELHDLREKLNSDRVVLLKASNGGGIPGPGKTLYATIIRESCSPSKESACMYTDWQNRLIDEYYLDMVMSVFRDKEKVNKVSEMSEFSVLRGAYEKVNIKQTRLLDIGIYDNGYYFLSAAEDENKKLTPAERYDLDTSVQRIRKLLD